MARSTALTNAVERRSRPRPSPRARSRVELVAQLLDLLEHALELVLGAVQLAREPRDVGAPGEPQVAQHRSATSKPIRVSAATFSALSASSRPKLGLCDERLERLGRVRISASS